MRTATAPLFVALVALASAAQAELPRHGRYSCRLGGQGACGDGAEAVCLGNRIRRGRPTIFLTVDFDRDRADLNGIDGMIERNSPPGRDRISWFLGTLGTPDVAAYDLNGTPYVGLRLEGRTANFTCRRAQ
jgi:hypothetical protein